MAVYVDEAKHGLGRMVMCHMIADSREELLNMASNVGVDVRWIQKAGTALEHFDVCKTRRALAVKLGAIEITERELVMKCRARRGAL